MIKKYTNGYIDPLGYMALVIFLSRSFLFGIGYLNIILTSKYDSWLSIIIGIFIGFIPIFIISNNINNFNNKFMKYIILLLIMFGFTVLLNDFVNFACVKYLFDASTLFIALLFVIPSIYIVNKDIEAIGRSALFMLYINIIIFIVITLSLIKYIDINNLKPMFITNNLDIIKSSLYFISYSITPILFLNIIPKNNKKYKEYKKYLIIGYIISSISSLILIFITLTVSNYEYISLFNYPLYFTLERIKYNFISNPENILSFFFVIDYFFSIVIYMYILKYYLINEFKLKEKILNFTYLILISLLVLISVFVYKNINIVHIFSNGLLFYIFIIFLIIMISVLALKRNKN